MKITEKQAIENLTGIVIVMKNKIEVFENQTPETCESEGLFITPDERLLCASLEIVLNKAKANILFNVKKDGEG